MKIDRLIGISIADGYKINKTLLTSSDMKAIFAGLKSLDSVSGTNPYQQLMDKLSPDCSGGAFSGQYISIDLSSWYVWGYCVDKEDFRLYLLRDSFMPAFCLSRKPNGV